MSKNKPIVSIIVPCYKQAHLLPETLESVWAQTYPNWECVMVDDGSPDNTEEVAKAYCEKDARFKYVRKENGGLASARNYGIAHSEGEYILPLDSDDLIVATYLEEAIERFTSHPETKLVYCQAERFGAENGLWDLPEYSYECLVGWNIIFCTSMYRRSDFNKTNGYNTNMKYGFEDWDFWLTFLKPEDVVYRIPKVLFYYRIKGGSMLQTMGPTMEYTLKQLGKNHPDIYGKYTPDALWNGYALDYYKNSLPYRLGMKILRPYRKLKSILTGKKYKEY